MPDIDRLLELAITIASRSPSQPRKVGEVLVLADGETTLIHLDRDAALMHALSLGNA